MITVEKLSRNIVTSHKEKLSLLNNISFEMNSGEVLALVGHNGSGKSTLIKCICGVIKPTSGKACIDGMDTFKKRKKLVSQYGVLFSQKASFIQDLSVKDNLLYFKAIYGIDNKTFEARMQELNKYFDIFDLMERPFRKLSFGERIRCELLSILLHDPEYIFLDEPTIGLDYKYKENLHRLLGKIKSRGKTVIIATHEIDYIESLCDKVMILEHGNNMYYGNPKSALEKISGAKNVIVDYLSEVDTELIRELVKQYHGMIVSNSSVKFFYDSDDDLKSIIRKSTDAFEVKGIFVEEGTIKGALKYALEKDN